MGGKHKIGELSRPTNTLMMWKSQSMRHSDPSPPIALLFYESSIVRQNKISKIYSRVAQLKKR